MGDVILLHKPTGPIEEARDLLAGMADNLELIPVENENGRMMRDVIAERVAEAHDILQDIIETQGEG
ncbi:hypothetical protein [Sodalis praecaptivus]|uniref:hypothetical protein n=1 Tax=Sodalis TaxID=84565 RepID=UPI00046CEF65|nr:hypothetical protein [Sodalis praecaptivus]